LVAVGALDPEKILAVLVIALIVLGPEKLPRVARQLGAAWRELTKFRDKVEREVRDAFPDVDLPKIPARPGAAVAGFLSDLTAPLSAPLPAKSSGQNGSTPAGAAGEGEPAAEPAANLLADPAARRTLPAVTPLPFERAFAPVDDPSMN
jgi:sec-independent protein translocase protein TatB